MVLLHKQEKNALVPFKMTDRFQLNMQKKTKKTGRVTGGK
jgi:hypothetical protein